MLSSEARTIAKEDCGEANQSNNHRDGSGQHKLE